MLIHSGGPASLLSEEMQATLQKISGVQSNDELTEKIKDLSFISMIRSYVRDEEIETIFGKQVAAVKKSLNSMEAATTIDDKEDFVRGWGWRLLPNNHPTFDDPKYLAAVTRNAGANTVGGKQIDPSDAFKVFEGEFQKLAPSNVDILRFYSTGSDANNALFEIASQVAAQRSGLGWGEKIEGEILYFKNVYGGGRGKSSEMGQVIPMSTGRNGKNLVNFETHTYTFNPQSAAETERLKIEEEGALAFMRARLEESKTIGGIFLEPILGAGGVMSYRSSFLEKVRVLADEFQVPIFADEILTGGGRTGKFFAYQHYEGFEPDFVTFGKGLQAAGLAQVRRGTYNSISSFEIVTSKFYVEPLLKGAQVLKAIREENLIENAAETGKYFLKLLREEWITKKVESLNAEKKRYLDFIADLQNKIDYIKSHEAKEDLEKMIKEQSSLTERIDETKKRLGEITRKPRPNDEDRAEYKNLLSTLKSLDRELSNLSINLKVLKNSEETLAIYEKEISQYQERINTVEGKLTPEELSKEALREIRGFGMMIKGGDLRGQDPFRRALPPLTLTSEQVDRLLN